MSGDIAGLVGGAGVDTDREDLPTGDFTPMPAGWYPVDVEKAEIKETKAGTGKYVWLQLVVIGDRYANRRLFPKFNIVNPNAKAVEIGQRDLAGLGDACGLAVVSDTSQLVGKQLDVRVKIKQEDGRDPDNEVTAYAKLGTKSSGEGAVDKPKAAKGAKPAAPATAWNKPKETSAAPAAAATTAEAPKPAAAKRPWEK